MTTCPACSKRYELVSLSVSNRFAHFCIPSGRMMYSDGTVHTTDWRSASLEPEVPREPKPYQDLAEHINHSKHKRRIAAAARARKRNQARGAG